MKFPFFFLHFILLLSLQSCITASADWSEHLKETKEVYLNDCPAIKLDVEISEDTILKSRFEEATKRSLEYVNTFCKNKSLPIRLEIHQEEKTLPGFGTYFDLALSTVTFFIIPFTVDFIYNMKFTYKEKDYKKSFNIFYFNSIAILLAPHKWILFAGGSKDILEDAILSSLQDIQKDLKQMELKKNFDERLFVNPIELCFSDLKKCYNDPIVIQSLKGYFKDDALKTADEKKSVFAKRWKLERSKIFFGCYCRATPDPSMFPTCPVDNGLDSYCKINLECKRNGNANCAISFKKSLDSLIAGYYKTKTEDSEVPIEINEAEKIRSLDSLQKEFSISD